MIREALEWFLSLGKSEQKEIEGFIYSDKPLHKISRDPLADPIEVKHLSGIVDYIKNNYDDLDPVLIHVYSPTRVIVTSHFDRNKDRNNWIIASALLPDIPFDRFMDTDNFNILLQSCFVENSDRAKVLQVVGNVVEENEMRTADDGVSQTVTAKAGIAQREMVPVPNPVLLKPFRTFTEITQPESAFVFRMRRGDHGPTAALFEADGGAWKLDAIESIGNYLSDELLEEIEHGQVTIIA